MSLTVEQIKEKIRNEIEICNSLSIELKGGSAKAAKGRYGAIILAMQCLLVWIEEKERE